MTRSSYITISLAAILLVGGAIWQQRELGRLRTEHETLLEKARARGIEPGAEAAVPGKVERQRRDPLEEARSLADDLIRRAAGGGIYQSDWAAQVDLADRLHALNPAQLRVVIDAVLAAEPIPEQVRSDLAFHLLGRLAEDFPEEVLARLDKDLREDSPDYRFGEVLSISAIRFAEQDPEKAWKAFQDLQLDPGNRWFDSMRQSLLAGISRTDPALALQRAEDVGIDGTYFLRAGERTIDQQLAALAALRAWTRGDPKKRAMLREHIEEETLKPTHDHPNRFADVTAWVEQAALPLNEIGFLADAGTHDLCSYIDPRETGKWIEWLCWKFPGNRIERRLQRLFEDHRTKAQAQAWLDGLPPDKAAAFKQRLAAE